MSVNFNKTHPPEMKRFVEEYLYSIAYSCDCVEFQITPFKFKNCLTKEQYVILNPRLKLINYFTSGRVSLTFTCTNCYYKSKP